MLILGQIVALMSTSNPPNMKVKLPRISEIEMIFDIGLGFFSGKKTKARSGNDLAL